MGSSATVPVRGAQLVVLLLTEELAPGSRAGSLRLSDAITPPIVKAGHGPIHPSAGVRPIELAVPV